MRAHYLQHVPFEGLGSIEPWLLDLGYRITATRFYEEPSLPPIDEADLLVVLGGPMSVTDVEQYGWLADEKRFIRDAIEHGIPVLGICLGAQLIAAALGARVFRNREREIGWFPVRRVGVIDDGGSRGEESPRSPRLPRTVFPPTVFPVTFEAFHWHGDTFDIPNGAIHLAESDVCRNQAFSVGPTVLALQFHLETTPQSAASLVENCRDELSPGAYVQSEDGILEDAPERYAAMNRLMDCVLETLTSKRT